MIIICTARMGKGTFEAKFIPLSGADAVEKIYVLRKADGPKINKVEYIILPKICRFRFFNIFITPFLLIYYTRKLRADLILSYHVIPHAFFAWIASRLTGKPYNISQTGLEIQDMARNFLYGHFIRHIFKKARFINVPGAKSKEFWMSLGIDGSKINILHSTIDTDLYVPAKVPKKYDIVFLGRLDPVKQIPEIIDTVNSLLKELPATNMVIIGSGPELPRLKKQVARLGLDGSVIFAGFTENAERWYNESRVFVMYSKSEGLPCAMMEAMSCEMLVVVPDVGNIRDVIAHGITGMLFKKNDSQRFYEYLKEALTRYDQFEAVRKQAREKIVRDHSFSCAVKKWNDVLSNLEGRKGRARPSGKS
jgi:glycosyltransferase involved in cell wall biosynthesis